MADATAVYEIKLEDETSGAATSAANALTSLRSSIDRDTKSLNEMQRAMKNLQMGGVVNVQQFQDLKKKIDAKRASIAQAQSSYIALGGSFGKAGGGGKKVLSLFEQLKQNAQGLGGPIGGVTQKVSGLSSLLAGGGLALGIAAVAAALLAVAAAAIYAAVSLAKYGIASANTYRNERLHLESMTKMRNMYGIAAGNAGEMQKSIDAVSASVSIGRDKVAEYSDHLYKAGLRGENLALALEGMAIKGSAAGDEQAKAFAGMAAHANLAGGSVKRLSDDVKARFGGIVAQQMLSLDVQSKKMHESFSALFTGLKIEGLLKAINMVQGLFSQSTASGRALKVLVGVMFKPIIAAVEFAAPLVKRFFQGMVIGALLLTITILKVRNWFKKTFGDSEILKGFNLQKVALWAGVAALGAFAAMLGVLGAMFVGVLSPLLVFGAALLGLKAIASKVFEFWQKTDWTELGTSLAMGIVNGIKNGAVWVVDAVKEMGGAAWAGFKSKLGIASPSKEFAKLGVSIAQGVEQGVDRGTPGVQTSVNDMVSVPKAPTTGAASSAPALSIGSITIQTAATDAKGIAASLRQELEHILEGVAIQMGAQRV